jgi:ribosomal protein S4
MSWNKYNLFNTTQRARVPNDANKTLYQQKWASKKDTRSYHGDQITERQWQSMFKTRLPTANTKVGGVEPHPPVFSLTFAEMERRLDFIVFRSNFAPSIYAARQLVGHGKVTVNGKPVSLFYLNPGSGQECRIKQDKEYVLSASNFFFLCQ